MVRNLASFMILNAIIIITCGPLFANDINSSSHFAFGQNPCTFACAQMICSFLPLPEVAATCRLSKDFNELYEEDDILWIFFYLKYFGNNEKKPPNYTYKSWIKRKLQLNNHILRMNLWSIETMENAISDGRFGLWELDLLNSNNTHLITFQKHRQLDERKYATSFFLAYFGLYIDISRDMARHLSYYLQAQYEGLISDWTEAHRDIYHLIASNGMSTNYKIAVARISKELRDAVIPTAQEKLIPLLAKLNGRTDRHIASWRLAKLFMLAYMSRPFFRINYFEPLVARLYNSSFTENKVYLTKETINYAVSQFNQKNIYLKFCAIIMLPILSYGSNYVVQETI